MRRLDEIDILYEYAFGRAFLANVYYSLQCSLLTDTAAVRSLICDILTVLHRGMPEDDARSAVHGILDRQYFAKIDPRAVRTGLSHSFRVVAMSGLIDSTGQLFNLRAASKSGFLKDRAKPARMQKLATLLKKPGAIRAGATIRTRHPFAWVASDAGALSRAMATSDSAKALVRMLALSGYDEGHPLFILQFPPAVAKTLAWRRPSAFEGMGNRLFKARTDADTATLADRGYTLSIDSLEVDPTSDRAHDGEPEHAALPVPLTADFGLTFSGHYKDSWVTLEEKVVLTVLTGQKNDRDLGVRDYIANIGEAVVSKLSV